MIERPRQSIDGCEVGGEQIGTVKHDDGERSSWHVRNVEPKLPMHGKRLGEKAVVWSKSSEMRHEVKRAAHVLRTACGEEGIEPRQHCAIDCR